MTLLYAPLVSHNVFFRTIEFKNSTYKCMYMYNLYIPGTKGYSEVDPSHIVCCSVKLALLFMCVELLHVLTDFLGRLKRLQKHVWPSHLWHIPDSDICSRIQGFWNYVQMQNCIIQLCQHIILKKMHNGA